jgi:hypothetical protein
MSIPRSPHLRPAGAAPQPTAASGDLRQIRDAVRGQSSEIPRTAAIEQLLASGYPNAHEELRALLEDESAPTRIRHLAAVSLPRTDRIAAERILVRALRPTDTVILAGVLRALGQIGGREALDAIERVLPDTRGAARKHAEFAVLLITHRLGIDGHEPPRAAAPPELLEQTPGANGRIRVRNALSAEAERALLSLGARPYGIELVTEPMYEFRCDRCSGMVLLNRELTGSDALATLRKRKAIFAIGALRNRSLGTYSTAALVLTSPDASGDAIHIAIYLTSGDLIFVGEAPVRNEVASWTLRAVRRLGAFPFRADGQFEKGQLLIRSAASGRHVVHQAAPEPIDLARPLSGAKGN